MSVQNPNDGYRKIVAAKNRAIKMERDKLVMQHRLKQMNQVIQQNKFSSNNMNLSPRVAKYAGQFGDDAPDAAPATPTTGATMANDPAQLRMFLNQNVDALNARIAAAESEYAKVQNDYRTAQSRLRGNIVPNDSASDMKSNFDNALPPHLRPGNVGDLNKVLWPFWFTAVADPILANSTGRSSISITQEAAFICVSFTKAVYVEITPGDGDFRYKDPADFASQNGITPGLSLTLRDASSSRMFSDRPQDINHYGWWQSPTVLPTPALFLPNAQLELSYTNESAVTYKPFITFFGYRLRIENAADLLGLVVG